MLNKYIRKSIVFLLIFAVIGCAINPTTTIVVKSVDDIPIISDEYSQPLTKLRKGMTIGQVNALFPNVERECYESGVCHFTVFDEKQIRLDSRIKGLNMLTGSLFSLLALTCALSEDSCAAALAAAVNVGVATSIEHANISQSHSPASLIALVQIINHGTLGTHVQLGESPTRSTSPKNITDVTLIQWINIEFDQGKVTQWAVNEPLEQFKPKSFKNELPALDEALGLEETKKNNKN